MDNYTLMTAHFTLLIINYRGLCDSNYFTNIASRTLLDPMIKSISHESSAGCLVAPGYDRTI